MGNMGKSKNTGLMYEITMILQDSYTQHLGMSRSGNHIEENLLDDINHRESSELYEKIQSVAENKKAQVKVENYSFQHEGIHYYDGGMDTTYIQTAIMVFSSAGGAAFFFKLAKDLLLKWMDNASRRSVKLKIDDIEVEIIGTNDVEKAHAALMKLEETKNKDKFKKKIKFVGNNT